MYTDKKYVKIVGGYCHGVTLGGYYEVNPDGRTFCDDSGSSHRTIEGLLKTSYELTDHKPFTKADLKNGMRCVSEQGSTYMYLDGDFVGYYGWQRGVDLDDDLLSTGSYPQHSIREVYKAPDRYSTLILEVNGGLLWERPKPEPAKPAPKEMTVADIEKALGHTIKVVK